MTALAPGSRLGRYEIRRSLGMGGMGQVYAVWDDDLNQEVALKILRQPNPEAVDAFKREFRALAEIRHPNLIQLYELSYEDARWFFTMELIAGRDFLTHVAVHRDPSFASLRAASRQLAGALSRLHEAGFLHRDVKPNNVIVERGGRVVLLDFGLIKEVARPDPGEPDRPLAGTIAYVSPELVDGEEPSWASDWYSFGVMLFEGLTGGLPFVGKPLEILDAKRDRPAPVAGDIADDVPDDLERLCAELLDRDPERRPTAAEILDRLGADEVPRLSRTRRPSLEAPFVGRPRHLEALAGAYDAVRSGRPVAVYVHGASGVGKSALVSRFVQNVAGQGAVVLAGRCYERESVPFKGFDMVVDELSWHLRRLPERKTTRLAPADVLDLARLFPALSWLQARAATQPPEQDTPLSQRQRALGALRQLLERVARASPLVIALDDLQWVDADTAALLRELMAPPDPPPLLLLLSLRAGLEPQPRALDQLRGAGSPLAVSSETLDVRELSVEPLGERDARELALALLEVSGDSAGVEADAISREAKGNPYFVSELARYVNERSKRASSSPGEAATSAPPTFEELILARAAALPGPTRRLLDVVALAGRPVPPRIAVRAADLAGDRHSLHQLLDESLVRLRSGPEASGVEPYHDRVRETLSAALGQADRRSLHRSLAEALEDSGRADPELLAVHLEGAGLSDRAAHYATLAAERAAGQLAFDRAARLYKKSLELVGPEDGRRRDLELRYAEMLANAGRSLVAASAYLAAARSEPESLALQRHAAHQLMRAGRADEGLEQFRDVLDGVGVRIPRTPWRAVLPLMLLRARVRLRGLEVRRDVARVPTAAELEGMEALYGVASGLAFVDPIRGLYFHCHHLLRVLGAGDLYRVTRALVAESAAVALRGTRSTARTERLVERVAALASQGVDNPPDLPLAPPAIVFIDMTVGLCRFQQARWPEALEPVKRVVDRLRRQTGAVSWELGIAEVHLVWILIYLGRIGDFRAEVALSHRSALERDDAYVKTALGFVEVFDHLFADDAEAAREAVRRTLEGAPGSSYRVHDYWALLTGVHVDLYAGEPERACERLETGWRRFARSLMGRVQLLNVVLRSSRAGAFAALARASEPRAARSLIRRCRREARRLARESSPMSVAVAAALRAAVASMTGDPEAAARHLEEAVSRFDTAEMALYAASCRLHLANLGRGSSREAEAALREAGVASPRRLARALVPGF